VALISRYDIYIQHVVSKANTTFILRKAFFFSDLNIALKGPAEHGYCIRV
jgi:hypothetical protein